LGYFAFCCNKNELKPPGDVYRGFILNFGYFKNGIYDPKSFRKHIFQVDELLFQEPTTKISDPSSKYCGSIDQNGEVIILSFYMENQKATLIARVFGG
jgi:hypothetical protein